MPSKSGPSFWTTIALCFAFVVSCSLLVEFFANEQKNDDELQYHQASSSSFSFARSLLDGVDSNEDLAIATAVFSLAAFIGNFGVALTGFGMAIFFLFVFTIADIIGLLDCSRCGIKDAVFYQSLALAAAVPVLFYKARKILRKNIDKTLLMTFIPATIAGTPIGKYLQEKVDSNVVKVVVGGTVSAVLFYELYKMLVQSEWYQNKFKDEEEVKEANTDAVDDSAGKPRRGKNRGSLFDTHAVRASCDTGDINGVVMYEDEEEKECADLAVGNIKSLRFTEDNNGDEENTTSPDQNLSQNKGGRSLKKFLDSSKRQLSGKVIPTGPALYIFGCIFGFLSGFLGGLIGIRGPPLIIFFLHFPYPKPVVKANGMLIMLCNVGIRVAYYIIEDVSGARETSWFDADLWYLYVSVMLCGILGVPIGHWASKKLDQQQFKMVIAFMLLLSGFSSLIKGSIDLYRAE